MVLIKKAQPPPCRYYEKGCCRDGDSCKFWHNPEIANTPCKHFAHGDCRLKDSCAYLHGDDARLAVTEKPEDQQRRFSSQNEVPEAPADAEICRYDPNCYRVNPDHLRKYRHPSRETLPPPRKLVAGESAYDWEQIRRVFPSDRSKAQAEERKRLFRMMDVNGNGMISLAELDKCIIENLGMGDVFPKKVLLRAFFFANTIAPKNGTLTDDMVTLSEFRTLMCALKRFLECFELFDAIDSLVERDGRIETAEIERGADVLKSVGLPDAAFDELIRRSRQPPGATMACAVAARNHLILFHEFCFDFALRYDLNVQPLDGFGRMFHGERPIKRWGEY